MSEGVPVPPATAVYDRRRRRLAKAHRARNSGRERQAIALYRNVLLEEPRNLAVALRLAPMLARRGERFEAWQLLRAVARELARQKRYEECLVVYRDACSWVPNEFDAWRMRAELELRLERDEAAFETLLDGRMCFAGKQERAQAIGLLLRAREIEPWDVDVALDLAQLYSRTDRAGAALELLAALAARVQGRGLRRVRALQWRITLSFRFAARWLQALQREWFQPALPSAGVPALDFDALEREQPR